MNLATSQTQGSMTLKVNTGHPRQKMEAQPIVPAGLYAGVERVQMQEWGRISKIA